jgi:hypothetical protein
MARIEQPPGERGSLKWLQQAINVDFATLNELIVPRLSGATSICWRSPLADDQYAEYRDVDFLDRIGASQLAGELAGFWPSRGPQWDALARCDDNNILLVEAKAHIGELCSPPSRAGPESSKRIKAALEETASFIGADPLAPWSSVFYQVANRLAHLYFLRKFGIKAWLVLINFIGDREMGGPSSAAEWMAAYQIVWHVLGIPKRHKLSAYIIEVFPAVPGSKA